MGATFFLPLVIQDAENTFSDTALCQGRSNPWRGFCSPHRNLHSGNTSPDSFQPVEEDIIFPAVKDFNATADAVFKHLGMWEIVAFLNFQD